MSIDDDPDGVRWDVSLGDRGMCGVADDRDGAAFAVGEYLDAAGVPAELIVELVPWFMPDPVAGPRAACRRRWISRDVLRRAVADVLVAGVKSC